MTLIQSQISHKGGFWSHQAQSSVSFASPSLPYSSGYEKQSSSGSKISPAVLFIIVILAVIFFISGLLHLLVRFLMKQRSSSVSESHPELSESDPFQRQLQQLFHLHDSGLDQAFIDALPVFPYKVIVMGSKEPFDCAVCLCEFGEKDKLRLLPTCSHAFHIDCIDTWLLSNSTCPLCRGNLLTPGIAFENPIFCFEDQKEEVEFSSNAGNGPSVGQKTAENHEIVNSKRVFSVRLGKYRSSDSGVVEGTEGETSSSSSSSSKLDVRRCYSMGSYQYVVADSDLQVTLCPSRGIQGGGSAATNSVKLLKGRNVHSGNASVVGDVEGKKINIRSKGDSFSVSKIWQWSRKVKFPNSSEPHLGSSSVTVDLPWNDHKTLGT